MGWGVGWGWGAARNQGLLQCSFAAMLVDQVDAGHSLEEGGGEQAGEGGTH
jgi:hypothetical protein